ncbi:MAG: hypothetical protein HN893_13825 [Rhodospirillales bacterium]|nr:hypothetical protein [Rhodospirillales bacterium]
MFYFERDDGTISDQIGNHGGKYNLFTDPLFANDLDMFSSQGLTSP